MSENPREPTIEERLARIEADLGVIKNATTTHAHWIIWLKAMVRQRPESIGQIPDSEVS
jgi:hypothetical protein